MSDAEECDSAGEDMDEEVVSEPDHAGDSESIIPEDGNLNDKRER